MTSKQITTLFSLLSIFLVSNISAFEMPEIDLPDGFQINVFTDEVPNARSMTLGDEMIFVSTMSEGKIYAITNYQDNPKVFVLASGLYMPNGIAFHENDLYVAEIHRVLKFENIEESLNGLIQNNDFNTNALSYSVISNYPKDRHHGWKYMVVGPDKKLYVQIGAPCNVCDEPDYAVITKINLDGSNKEIIAKGIRNTVGMTFHPQTKELWFTDNGRDMLGDDLPPGELNKVSFKGEHFGFPFCHGSKVVDPQYGSLGSCSDITAPVQELDAHVAPLGLKFYTGTMFPKDYHNQIFIPEHGSWNRSEKSGYRVTLVKLDEDQAISYETFASGWLKDEQSLGRPVDLLVLPDGSMLVSDDQNGVIYKITYNQYN